jgi:hypothetical protein
MWFWNTDSTMELMKTYFIFTIFFISWMGLAYIPMVAKWD